MSRLDFCQYELVGDCYDWKNDNCDECNIFKAYCEGARRAKNSIVRCKDCRHFTHYADGCGVCSEKDHILTYQNQNDFCNYGERREP